MISGNVTSRNVCHGRGAEVLGRLLERPVEPDQPRSDRDHDERQVEHHVRDQDRREAELRRARS